MWALIAWRHGSGFKGWEFTDQMGDRGAGLPRRPGGGRLLVVVIVKRAARAGALIELGPGVLAGPGTFDVFAGIPGRGRGRGLP
jgi:hypothetical protein